MVGRHPESRSGQSLEEIARIKVGGKPASVTELRQAISKNRYLDQLREKLEDQDPTKIAVLDYFCENNGPGEFMEVLREIGKREKGRDSLLRAYLDGSTFYKRSNSKYGEMGEFGDLKGRFAEIFMAYWLNFRLQGEGLRVLTPKEVKKFLGSLYKSFPVDGILLRPNSTSTEVVGIVEYKTGKTLHDTLRRRISSRLEHQTKLHNLLLSEKGKKRWPRLRQNLPLNLSKRSKRIEVASPKEFRHLIVVNRELISDTWILKLEKGNTKVLGPPFTVGELDKMTLVLLRDFCRAKQIIMQHD